MADIVVRVKADDQVSRVLDNIKRKADSLQKTSLGKQFMPGGIRAGGQTIAAGIRGDIGGGASTLASFGTSIASAMGGGMGTALTGVFTGVMALKDIGQSMQSTITEMFNSLKDASPMLQGVLRVLKMGFDNVLRPIGDTIAMLLMPAIMSFAIDSAGAYKTFAETMRDADPNVRLAALNDVMTQQLGFLGKFIADVIPAISDIVDSLLPVLENVIPKLITDAIPLITTVLKDWLPEILKALIEGFKLVAPKILTAMMLPSSTSPEAPISGYNQLMGGMYGQGFGATVASRWHFASGGIFNKPTLGVIGEAGPEAVIPLSRGGGIGGGLTIVVNGDIYGVQDLRSEIQSAIDAYAMRSNFRR